MLLIEELNFKPKLSCYLKIINTFLENNMNTLKQIVWETEKWH